MSRILVPIDFSIASHNAYRYGLHLARQLDLDVVVAHYYEGNLNPNEPLAISAGTSIRDTYLKRLRTFAHPSGNGVDYPLVEPPRGVHLSYEVDAVLSPSAAINARAKEEDVDLVVMSTRSNKKFLEGWLGSTSITVSEACPKPVFLIPPGVTFVPFDRLVVANNHATAAPLPLWQIKSLANFYGSEVHFVHVAKQEDSSRRFVPWALMAELAGEREGVNYPYEVVNVDEDDVTDGLLNYAENIEANLIVIVNRMRSWWHALLKASLTQSVALHSERMPILVLHTQFKGTKDRLMNAKGLAEHK